MRKEGEGMSDIEEQRKYYERMMDEIAVEHGRQICELQAENERLVDVLHEVRDEAVRTYRCLQHDCEHVMGEESHFFARWWSAECECDRLRRDNAALRELVRHMRKCIERLDRTDEDGGCILCPYEKTEYNCEFEQRMRELGVEA